jgi:UDP-3-O-acyl-N-acetylglucosamine deacetylase
LTSELSTCHDTISNLRNENAKLVAKVEKLDSSDDSIVNLRNDNANLIAKIEHLNASLSSLKIENEKLIAKELNVCKPSTSTVEHVTICTKCRDVNIDAIHDHIAMIK